MPVKETNIALQFDDLRRHLNRIRQLSAIGATSKAVPKGPASEILALIGEVAALALDDLTVKDHGERDIYARGIDEGLRRAAVPRDGSGEAPGEHGRARSLSA